MDMRKIRCKICADAGITKRGSWNSTKTYGVMVCGICQETTDMRKIDAMKRGGNRWFRKATVLGMNVLRCNTDGKWVLSSWDEAKMRAHFYGKYPYRSPECGEIHLASTPVRM